VTVKSDLQKALASAEAAKGTYSLFAESTEDQSAKDMFHQMSNEMDRHIHMLNSRIGYVTQNNQFHGQGNNEG
jgi:rubrerythrin